MVLSGNPVVPFPIELVKEDGDWKITYIEFGN